MNPCGRVSRPVLEAMVGRLAAALRPSLVILFGSQATGRTTADSDVDMIVVMPFAGRRLDAALAVRRVLREFPVAKDIVVMSPGEYERQKDVPGTIAWPAAHEGRVLHVG